jgi:competence protein ComEC
MQTASSAGLSQASPPLGDWSRTPLFLAAVLFALGEIASQFLFFSSSWLLIALAPLALLAAVSARRAQRLRWLPLAALWTLLGCWCVLMQPQPAPDAQLAASSDGLLRTVEGSIVNASSPRIERQADDGEQPSPTQSIDLALSAIEEVDDAHDALVPAQGKVRLSIRGDSIPAQPFACGERIRAVVRLLPPPIYRDPGAWSRADFLLQQEITSTASVPSVRIERLNRDGVLSFSCRLGNLRRMLSARILALPAEMRWLPPQLRLSDEDAVMLSAMATGDRTYLTHALRVGFERTGSFHMLVVSGLHLAIVAGCVFWIARKLRAPRVAAIFLTIAISFAYALFTGFATPVQRSLWMVTLYLLGRLVYRERSPLNAIGFAALCLLAADPRSLFESSFQMTLLAVVAIAGVAAPLLKNTVHPYLSATRDLRLKEIDGKLSPPLAQFRVEMRMMAQALAPICGRTLSWRGFPGCARFVLRVVELIVVALVVELAMTLPMALYFHRITVFALPVNILILPLLSVLLPAALLTLLTLLIWPAAAAVPGAVAAGFLHMGVGLVHLFGGFALGDLRIATPLFWQSAAFYLLLAAGVILALTQRRRLAALALIAAALCAVLPRPVDRPRGAMLVEAIDVGQGDSILIVTPEGKTLLVDGGGFGGPRPASESFDVGDEVVSAALWSRGLRRLDAVALSHAHSDHMGGVPAVLRNFRPAELWIGDNPSSPDYVALLNEARDLRVMVRSFHAGDSFSFGGAQVLAMAPARNRRPGPAPANNDSLVLHVANGATSVQLEGDAEASVEESLLNDPQLKSTLLKVGHHGSANATSAQFLARVHPQFAVISCGRRNRFGHPRTETLEKLQAAGAQTFRTDLMGASCFVLDGRNAAYLPNCGWNKAY